MADAEDELGEGTGRSGPWRQPEEQRRASKQQGDVHALDVEGDPRGGVQSDAYRRADPRDVVEEGDVAMGGPGGSPQEDVSIEERRAASEEWRARKFGRADQSESSDEERPA